MTGVRPPIKGVLYFISETQFCKHFQTVCVNLDYDDVRMISRNYVVSLKRCMRDADKYQISVSKVLNSGKSRFRIHEVQLQFIFFCGDVKVASLLIAE